MTRCRTMYDGHGCEMITAWAWRLAPRIPAIPAEQPVMTWARGGPAPCAPLREPDLRTRLWEYQGLIKYGAVADLRAAVKANERQRVVWLAWLSGVSPELWRRHLGDKQWRSERIPPEIRKQVRGSGPCAYCGDPDPGEVDHVIPVAQGGTCNPRNLVPACGPCNRAKGGRTPEQWAAGAPIHPNAAVQ